MLQRYDPRNANLIVNINGRLVRRDEEGVSPFDSSVQNGDAVWEGLRLYDGRIFRLRQHLARLRASAAALRYENLPDDAHIIRELARTLEANQMTDGVHVRLTVTRGVKYTSETRSPMKVPVSPGRSFAPNTFMYHACISFCCAPKKWM